MEILGGNRVPLAQLAGVDGRTMSKGKFDRFLVNRPGDIVNAVVGKLRTYLHSKHQVPTELRLYIEDEKDPLRVDCLLGDGSVQTRREAIRRGVAELLKLSEDQMVTATLGNHRYAIITVLKES